MRAQMAWEKMQGEQAKLDAWRQATPIDPAKVCVSACPAAAPRVIAAANVINGADPDVEAKAPFCQPINISAFVEHLRKK